MTDTAAIQLPVLILAGGFGTRLQTVVTDVPKPLMPVAGRPFLARLIAQASAAGASEVILCAGHKASSIEAFALAGQFDTPVRVSIEDKPLGTGGAVMLAMRLFADTTFVIMNGDSFADINFHEMLAGHRRRHAIATIAVSVVADKSRYGSVTFDSDLAITSFREKVSCAAAGYINAGVYVVARSIFDRATSDVSVSLEHDIFPSCTGTGLYAFPSVGKFIDIGTADDFERAQTFFSPPSDTAD